MKGYPGKLGITWDNLMDLGRHNPGDKEERFCMSVFACKTCQEVKVSASCINRYPSKCLRRSGRDTSRKRTMWVM